MSLVGLLAALVVVAVLLYFFNHPTPDPRTRNLLSGIVIVVVVLWLVDVFFGFSPSVGHGSFQFTRHL